MMSRMLHLQHVWNDSSFDRSDVRSTAAVPMLQLIFKSTPKSRPNNMGLMSVRPSTKSFSDSDEIRYVGRSR